MDIRFQQRPWPVLQSHGHDFGGLGISLAIPRRFEGGPKTDNINESSQCGKRHAYLEGPKWTDSTTAENEAVCEGQEERRDQ